MTKITPLKITIEELQQQIAINKQLAKSEAIYKRFKIIDVIEFINSSEDRELIELFNRASRDITKYRLSNSAIINQSESFINISDEDYARDEKVKNNFYFEIFSNLAWEENSSQKATLEQICQDFFNANGNNAYSKQQVITAISDNSSKKVNKSIDLSETANTTISPDQMVALPITGENNNCGYVTLAHLMLEHMQWIKSHLNLLESNSLLRKGLVNYFSFFDIEVNDENLKDLINGEIEYLNEVFESKKSIKDFQENSWSIRIAVAKKLLLAIENPADHQYLNLAIESELRILEDDIVEIKTDLPNWAAKYNNSIKSVANNLIQAINGNRRISIRQKKVILDVINNGTMNITMLQALGMHVGLPINIFDKPGTLTSSKYSALLGETNVNELEVIPDYYVQNVGNHWVPLLKAGEVVNRDAFKDDIKLKSTGDYLAQFYNTLGILSKNPIAANFNDVEVKTSIVNIKEFEQIINSLNLIEKENSRGSWEIQEKNENSISLKKDASRVEYFAKTGILTFTSITNKKEAYEQDLYNFARLALNTNKQASKPGTAIIRTEDPKKAVTIAKMMLAAGCKIKIADEVMAKHKDNKELQALLTNKAKSSLSL